MSVPSGPTPDLLRDLVRLVVDAEARGGARSSALERLVREATGDPTLVEWMDRNRMGPLVARALRRADPSAPLSAPLTASAHEAATQALAAVPALHGIARVLGDAGIPWMLWKGPALALRGWDDLGARPFTDLDVVVRPADRTGAVRALAGAGWRPRDGMSLRQQRWLLAGSGAYDLEHDDVPMLLELHWRFASARFPEGPGVGAVLGRATAVVIGELPVSSPEAADSLLLQAMHGTKHGWSQAEEVATFWRLTRRAPDAVGTAAERAKREGLDRAWQQAMDLVRWFEATDGGPVGGDGSGDSPRDASLARMLRGDAGWRPDHRWSTGWMSRRVDRARYWVHALLAPTREEWKWVRLPGALAWLYPVVRLLRLAIRR